MKAVIMAGGQGTHLRPLTSNQPKPMIPIANVPCMEHIMNLLKEHGFIDIVVTLQFMPEEIQDYFGDGSGWGLPAPDCFMTLTRALELFREQPLSEIRLRFGETFGAVRRWRLECPWGAKGRVMRGLAEKFGGDADAILTDGVKLNLDSGWVLMLPDPDNPLFYVYAEADANGFTGRGREVSEGLVSGYAEFVEDLIESE